MDVPVEEGPWAYPPCQTLGVHGQCGLVTFGPVQADPFQECRAAPTCCELRQLGGQCPGMTVSASDMVAEQNLHLTSRSGSAQSIWCTCAPS